MRLNETRNLTSASTSVLPMVRSYLRPQRGKLNLGNVSPGRGALGFSKAREGVGGTAWCGAGPAGCTRGASPWEGPEG